MNTTNKSYNLILNSATQSASTNKSSVEYTIDWSFLPNDKQFEVYFTFMSNTTTTSSATEIPMVYINAFDSVNMIEPRINSTAAIKSTLLGFLNLNAIGSNTFFRTDATMNCPVFLERRPQRNTFNVDIYKSSATLTNSNSPVLWNNGQATPANMPNYTLTLMFYEA